MQTAAGASAESRILIVDDQVLVAEMIREMLHDEHDILISHVTDADKALEAALSFKPTVVLVDLMMPLIDGFGVIRSLRMHFGAQCMPLVLLSSEDMPEQKARGFAEGASDYLVKWPSKLELSARIRYHSAAFVAQRERDEAFLSLQQSREELLHKSRQLADSQDALHQAQKMEAVGKLTGGVAHDFNNVLQVISGHLQIMKFEASGNEKLRQRISAALAGVERGAKLSSQLLAFGRRQPLKPVVTDVGALVRGMHDLLRRSIGELTEVETRVSDDIWHALVDPNHLENVILNLVINARDAMSGAGKLLIEVENFIFSEGSEDAPPGMGAGEYVKIAVCDSGTGMTDEVMDQAFEPFFTTKPAGQGTGLGLSMAYGFVKQSGGHITIESRIGAGTTVKIYLPRTTEEAAQTCAAPAVLSNIDGGSETVLVVEDESEVRATTISMLEALGYKTLQAADARSALNILQSGICVDLLFTDVIMPGALRTEELAKKAQELVPGICILYASGFVDGGLVQAGKLHPDVVLLHKPYSAESLARNIREVLDRCKANARPAIAQMRRI